MRKHPLTHFDVTFDAYNRHQKEQHNAFFFVSLNAKMIEGLDRAKSPDELFALALEASTKIQEMAKAISNGKIEDASIFLFLIAQCLEFQLAGLVFDASIGKWIPKKEEH